LLLFDKHINGKLNEAYMVLSTLKRNFVHISGNCFVTLYKSLVEYYFEYANNSVWYPERKMVVEKLVDGIYLIVISDETVNTFAKRLDKF